MRTIRALTTAAALMTAALPGLASAQQGRQFRDAWFWGFKTGAFMFADENQHYSVAPLAGFEWMITRTYGGLYAAASQGFMSTHTLFATNPTAPDSNFRAIKLENVRRLDVAAVGFPGRHVKFHPYVGAGFSMVQVPSAHSETGYNSQAEFDATQALIQDLKVSFTPLVMAGAQYRLRMMSVFGQVIVSPVQENFLLFNGRTVTAAFEFGLRYNIGTSIDKNP